MRYICLLFILLLANQVLANKICQQRLKFPCIQVNSTLDVFIDEKEHLYPIDPPLSLQEKGLHKFFHMFQEEIITNFPSLTQIYAIHDGNERSGYQIEFRLTFSNPRRYPNVLVWVPKGKNPRRKYFIGGCDEIKNEL